jgi:hypothetical protein
MTSIDTEVRARIERYLGRVEAHLEGVPEEEREEVLRDVEAHVYDALARREIEGTPEEVAKAVLREMDPPSSWGPAPSAPSAVLPPAAPAAAGPRFGIDSLLLGLAAVMLFVCFLPIWGEGVEAVDAPKFGIAVFGLLLGLGGAIALARASNLAAGLSPLEQRSRIGAASFFLLLFALGSLVAGLTVAMSAPGYGGYSMRHLTPTEYENLRMLNKARNDLAYVVYAVSVFVSSTALLLSWVLGRFALSTGRGGERISGWDRYRAAIAPALGSAGILFGLLMLAFGAGFVGYHLHAEYGFGKGFRRELFAFSAMAAALSVILVGSGLVVRFTPDFARLVLYPLTARLKPSQAKWFHRAAGVIFLIAVVLYLLRFTRE